MRGLAILMVMLVHTYGTGQNGLPALLHPLLEHGARGVQLFFVASAFTLFLSFENRKQKEETPVRNFFIRRFFRIAPMYYLGIAYFLWQDGWGDRYWLGSQDAITTGNVLANVFFVHWLNPYWITSLVPGGWSITVEMTFYLLVPLLFRLLRSLDHATRALVASLLLCLVLHAMLSGISFVADPFIWQYYLFLYFPAQLPVFLMGIMAFFVVARRDYVIRPGTLLWLAATGLVTLLTYPYAYVLLFAAFFVALLVTLSRRPFRLLVNAGTVFVGKVSYSAYLVHFAVLHWLRQWNLLDVLPTHRQTLALLNFGLKYVMVVLLTVGISYVFYKVIEVPFQRLGNKLAGSFTPQPVREPGL
jgi:peptidoglycan/LPS O-acetylase OafA/YrhL